jgi:tRNA A-37 threonylcarbamoyl transferase component Bud32
MAPAAQSDERSFSTTPGLYAGKVIAERYAVERVIGSGGMATIVEAMHLELGSRVAIKVLHPTHTLPEAIDRFLREARGVFPLHSENVCRVLDLGRLPDGPPFIVMEYLDGTDFATAFRGKQIAPSLAASYIVQACKGLAEAHALGIVHRDIKPANLFLTKRSDGSALVKVLDFGISRLRREGDDTLTSDGQILGTPRYMAPEQFGGAMHADARADVWAIGLVLFKLVVGRLPFEATSLTDIYAEVMSTPPEDIRRAVPSIDPALGAVVMRCLERDPAKRFQTARELGAALEPFARAGGKEVLLAVAPDAPPTIARPAPRSWRAVALVFLGVAGVSFGATALFIARSHAPPPPPPDISSTTSAATADPPPPPPTTSTAVVPGPPPTATTTNAPKRPTGTAKPTGRKPSCSPPYYFDEHHDKVFRPECFH